MFFFKKKKVVVDCFTPLRSVYEAYKIRNASVYYPEIIKQMPDQVMTKHKQTMIDIPMATIKRCSGIKEWYKSSAIIPMWTDFICQPKSYLENKSALAIMPEPFYHDQHPEFQYPGMFKEYIHVKLHNVWHIKETTGIKFMWTPAVYNLEKHWENFIIPPCTTYFDIQRQSNVNLFIKKTSDNFTLEAGTPLVLLTPLTEYNVEYKCHLVSVEEFKNQGTPPDEFSFFNVRRNRRYKKELLKQQEFDRQESKCPFGFGK